MNIEKHTNPEQLEKYSFLWSQVRLIIAAVALFIGGTPPLMLMNLPGSMTKSILTIAWILSGLASGYLLYRWHSRGHMLFGKKTMTDRIIFLVSGVTGLNLGLVGLTGNNIGMSVSSNRVVFFLTGLVYFYVAYYLQKRWQEYGRKI